MSENPAGWHPDPLGRHEHRYWDGDKWTEHVADQGNLSTDPLEAAEPEKVAAPIGPSMINLPAISPAGTPVTQEPAATEPAAAQSVSAEPAQSEPVTPVATPAASTPATTTTGRDPDWADDERIESAERFAASVVPASKVWPAVAATSLLLLASLLMPWYSVSVDVGAAGFNVDTSVSANAFEALSLIDLILFAAGIIALAVAIGALTGRPILQQLPPITIPAIGALCTLLVLYRLIFTGIDAPDGVDIGRGIGIFLALLASIGLLVAGLASSARR